MTCKNCIHDGVCYLQEVTNDIAEQLREFDCEDFKNKADFTEVVRCKDCRNRIEKSWAKCAGRKPDDFCSDGERRYT